MRKSTKISPPLSLGHENRFEKLARIVICVLMLMIMGLLTLSSILHTTGMDIVPTLENVSYLNDNPFLNVIFLVLSVFVCFLIMPRLKKVPLWAEILFITAWTVTLGVIWVYSSQSAPTEDSVRVTKAAFEFANDRYAYLDERYYKNYSFQLGYIFFDEIIFRFAMNFGEIKNYLFLEVLNVIFLASAYIGIILINDKLFTDKRIRHLTAFLLVFSFQPIIFSTFLYGIIPGLMFAVWAVYFEIVWFKDGKIYAGILSAVFIALAVMIKTNNNIVLVAMLCVAFVKLFARSPKRLYKVVSNIIYMALCAGLALSVSPAVKTMYEKRSGIDLGEPIPYISWIAMGLNESECAPGWYNYTMTLTNFENNNFDADEASKDSLKVVKDRIKLFKKDGQYANDFFYEKFVSQWNETTYQSIWTNEVRGQYEPKGEFAAWVCDKGQKGVSAYMDIYAQLIFASVLVGVFACLRKKNFLATMFPLIILGGVLYHLMAEAK